MASITVIILILLLALTVNSAREKDMVELFSRQQLANPFKIRRNKNGRYFFAG
ncbi:MAG: hypothetical protein MZV70_27290 [Desulfobacterales bacterium]|nr:hypothetical protein [Desulfobacterales bacterium]